MVATQDQPFPSPGPAVKRANESVEAAENLEQTLDHFEAMLEALESHVEPDVPSGAAAQDASSAPEPSATAGAMNRSVDRLEKMLNRLATQAQRLADGASDLAQVAGQMEGRMGEVARAMRETPAREPAAKAASLDDAAAGSESVLEPSAPVEPQFDSASSLSVVLAGVPGFQGLMDTQRALTGMPETEGASVVAFKNGEASLEVALNAPVTARQIVDGVRIATGEQLVIEESRPEDAKLRLRFVDHAGGASA